MSGLGCDRTHGRSGSAQIETNKFQSTLPEGSDRRHQQICGASLRRRVERPHHDTSQVVHLLKIPDFLFNRNVLLRRSQYRFADDTDSSARFARSFVIGKIFNSRWVLERTKRDHNLRVNVKRLSGQSQALSGYLKQVSGCNDVDAIRGLEGLAAKDYFYVFDDLILRSKDDFFFEQRSRRPPLDRMNALLSFSYSLLTGDCLAALQGVGLDPYVGFLHVDRPGRPSLALDLMEEFRPALADRFALTLVNLGSISAGDFEQRENGGVFLNDAGRKTVLAAWQKRKQEVITHPFLGEKMPWGLIPYVQALLLARAIRGDIDAYPPFMWK